MSKKYKLSYTAADIDRRLATVSQLSKDVEQLSIDAEQMSTDIEQLSTDADKLSTDVKQLFTDTEQMSMDISTNKNHASQHASDGLDPINPEDIGAMIDVPVTSSDDGKFLCVVNGNWAAVNATIGDDTNSISVAEKAVRDGDGNVIVDTYEIKDDANTKLTEAKSYADEKLAEAKSYTDDALANVNVSDDVLTEAKSYTESYADEKLAEAKSYTDDAIESAFANIGIAEQMSF